MSRILITGASGTIGSQLVRELLAVGESPVAALRDPQGAEAAELRRLGLEIRQLDFATGSFQEGIFDDIDRMLLLRPPQITSAERSFGPLLNEAVRAGLRQVVFLSLLGAEHNRVVPHYAIEQLIFRSGLPYTLLRPSFFMQNMNGAHRKEIRELGEIIVPAGEGLTSFIDGRDIAEVARICLSTPGHINAAYPLTGSEALSYHQVAEILSRVLGRPIRYRRPGILRFVFHRLRLGDPLAFIAVMVGIYTVARLGKAGTITPHAEELLGRRRRSFEDFAVDAKASLS